jgi:hypothetical protein
MFTTIATYRQQITLAARSMAVADDEAATGAHAPARAGESIRLFAGGSRDQRFVRLQSACELLADGFDQLDERIRAYVATVPLSSDDSVSNDAERFLDWLEQCVDLDEEQRDFIAALRAQHAVELVAVRQRLAHVRFQEQLSMTDRLLGELETNRRLRIHLNPIHVWSQLETHVLLDEGDDLPATVLFYPVGSDVRTVVVEADAEDLLRDLNQSGATTVTALLRRTRFGRRRKVLNLLRELARLSVIALG